MFLSKINKLILIFIILVLTAAMVLFYRSFTRNIVNANVTDIRIMKMYTPLDGGIDDKSKKTIEGDVENYAYIVFVIKTKNQSNYYNVSNIYFDPIIPEFLNKKVLWYDKSGDAPTNSIMTLKPARSKEFGRSLIIRRDNLTDSQLINLFKSLRFNISYISYNNKNQFIKYLTMGYSRDKSN